MVSNNTLKRHKRSLNTALQGIASVNSISQTDTHINADIALDSSNSSSSIVRINHCLLNNMYIIDIIHDETSAHPNLKLGLARISFINKLLSTLEKFDKRSIIAQECLRTYDNWARSNTCI